MKTFIRIVLVTLVSILLSTLIKTIPGEFFISTIFNVSGIMFSVGLGLIVTFNMNGIKNKAVISSIRTNLNTVRDSFIIYFSLTTAVYLLSKLLCKQPITTISLFDFDLAINWTIVFCLLMIFGIMYFIINFFQIQKLNEQIYDELNK